MRIRVGSIAIMTVMLLAGSTPVRPQAADGPYQLVKDIPIGGEGGWDYLNVDSAAKRLYVSHSTKVVVVDMAKDEIVGEIADTPGVHGAIATVPGRVFSSNGRENKASIVEDAADDRQGRHRRESRFHNVRAEAERGVHVQRQRPFGHGD